MIFKKIKKNNYYNLNIYQNYTYEIKRKELIYTIIVSFNLFAFF